MTSILHEHQRYCHFSNTDGVQIIFCTGFRFNPMGYEADLQKR